jgi:uncharacterized membrane-anchored protein
MAQASAPATNDIAAAVDLAAAQEAAQNAAMAKLKSLKPASGIVKLPDAKATLTVPAGYGFLDKAQSKVLLTEVWSNPPEESEGVLGILLKVKGGAIDDTWAAVITFDDSGYVTDTDAADIDPAKLLAEEQAAEVAMNQARIKEGYGSVNFTGWAEPPSYDAAGNRIYWAKRLKFSDAETESLNYNIRVLGRRGYLAMNFVAGLQDLPAVKAAAPDVLKIATFDAGETYADFNDGDKASGLGLAGLIGGAAAVGVAKKLGLLAIIIAFAKKGFVIIIPLFLWLWSKFKGVFNKKDEEVVGSFQQSDQDVEIAPQSPVKIDEGGVLLPQNPPSNSV